MLRMQYIGLLNTDRVHKGPVQVYLQGRESDTRYVLDRIPPWIEALFTHAQEMHADSRYIQGANLDVLGPKASKALYHQLVEEQYKVKRSCGSEDYRWVKDVFVP